MSEVMRKALAVAVLVSSAFAWAQAPIGPRDQMSSADSAMDRRIQQDAFEKWSLDTDGAKKRAEAAKESAAAQQFYSKAQRFVDLWEAFAAQLNEKKTFNAKLAQKISKAFHDLEKSEGWPVGIPK